MTDDDREDLGLAGLVHRLSPPTRPKPDDAATSDQEADELLRRLDRDLPRPSRIVLCAVAIIAAAQTFLVAPWLVGSDPFGLLGSSSSSHLTRDGSMGLIVAAAGLLTVWRPRWAVPSFVIASIALVAQTVAGLVDEGIARDGSNELVHLPSVVLTCLIGLSAVRLPPLGPRRRRLRSVPDRRHTD